MDTWVEYGEFSVRRLHSVHCSNCVYTSFFLPFLSASPYPLRSAPCTHSHRPRRRKLTLHSCVHRPVSRGQGMLLSIPHKSILPDIKGLYEGMDASAARSIGPPQNCNSCVRGKHQEIENDVAISEQTSIGSRDRGRQTHTWMIT